MRRVRFRDLSGQVRTGKWNEGEIEWGNETFNPESVDVLPPTVPSKIVGVSTNSRDFFRDEEFVEKHDLEVPDRPKLFVKTPNAVIGHGDTVSLLPGEELEWESELAAVIGTQCREVSRNEAMSVVEGFTCMNDITLQSDRDPYGVRFKSVDTTAPIGPVVSSPDLVPSDATIELRVNGEVKQHHSRSDLIFTVPEIIEEITSYMTLETGDVIPLGTARGVGSLSDGDRVEIEIEGIGSLVHHCRSRGPAVRDRDV